MAIDPSKASPPVIALCWSLAEEPDFLRYLQDTYGDYLIGPLRYRAMKTARRFVPADKILDMATVVPAEDGAALWDRAVEWENRLMAALRKSRGEAWIAGLEVYDLCRILAYVLYWRLAFQRLRERFPGSPIRCHGPFSGGAKGFDGPIGAVIVADLIYQQLFSSPARGFSVRFKLLFERAAAAAGYLLNRWPSWFAHRANTDWPVLPKTKVVLFGLPPGDWMAQRGLMARLIAAGAHDVRWLIAERPHFAFQADESGSVLNEMVKQQTDALPVNSRKELPVLVWRRPAFARITGYGLSAVLKRRLQEIPGFQLEPALAAGLARLIASSAPDLRLQYEGVAELLRQYDPETIVTQSCVEWANMAAVWAALHHRRHVRLPHGTEPEYRAAFLWHADELGVLGADQEKRIQDAGSTRANIHRVGSMHLGDTFGKRNRPPSTSGHVVTRRLCYLATRLMVNGIRGYGWQVLDDILGLGRVMARNGWRLLVRPQRGPADEDAYDEIREQIEHHQWPGELSDALSSLREDLARSDAAILSQWGGAGVAALYADKPLIGWLPRPIHTASDEILRELPLLVAKAGDLPALLMRLESEATWRQEVLSRQGGLLARLIEDPDGDPYSRAIRLIMNVNSSNPTEFI